MHLAEVKEQYKIDGKRVFIADKLVFEAGEQDEVFQQGSVLFKKHAGKYDIYILSSLDYELYELHKGADDYIYQKGLLLIKVTGKYWIVVCTFDFSFNLAKENIENRKSKLLKLIISQQGDIDIIYTETSRVFINFENKGYLITCNDELDMCLYQADGVYEKLPIAYLIKLKENNNTESFVNELGSKQLGKNSFCNFHKIEKFKDEDYPMIEGYHGYWGKDENGNIRGLYISGENDYSYDVCFNFTKPVEKIKFCTRELLNEERTLAIDVWKIITIDGEESFIFQTIGKINSNSVIRFVMNKEQFC